MSGAWWNVSLHATVDTGRLEDTDQDRERSLSVHLAEEDHLLIVNFTDDDPRQLHLYEHGLSFRSQATLSDVPPPVCGQRTP